MSLSEVISTLRREGLPATATKIHHAIYIEAIDRPRQSANRYVFDQQHLDQLRYYLTHATQGCKFRKDVRHEHASV